MNHLEAALAWRTLSQEERDHRNAISQKAAELGALEDLVGEYGRIYAVGVTHGRRYAHLREVLTYRLNQHALAQSEWGSALAMQSAAYTRGFVEGWCG